MAAIFFIVDAKLHLKITSARTNCLEIVKFIIVDSQLFRFIWQMVVFSPESIPAKNNQPNCNGGKDGNDDNPDDRVIDVFFPCGVNIGNGTIDKFVNNERSNQ